MLVIDQRKCQITTFKYILLWIWKLWIMSVSKHNFIFCTNCTAAKSLMKTRYVQDRAWARIYNVHLTKVRNKVCSKTLEKSGLVQMGNMNRLIPKDTSCSFLWHFSSGFCTSKYLSEVCRQPVICTLFSCSSHWFVEKFNLIGIHCDATTY